MVTKTPYGGPTDYIAEEALKAQPEYVEVPTITHFEEATAGVAIVPSVAVKFDSGKAPLSMIPREAMEQLAHVMAYGAKKYGRDNYKSGMNYSRVIDACLRHIYAFNSKENLDKESSLPHLAHAMANLAMLTFYVENGKGKDDR